MARSRGSSSSRRSSGSSRRSSSRSHSSSSSRSRSSFGSSSRSYSSSKSYSSPCSHSYKPKHHGHYGHHSSPSRTNIYVNNYGGGYSSSSYRPTSIRSTVSTISRIYAAMFAILFIALCLFALPSFFRTSYSANKIDEEAVTSYAESRYNFEDESHLLLFYTYFEKTDTDYATLVFGYDASDIISNDLEDYFWEVYDDNFYSDLNDSQWLGYTFEDVANEYKQTSNGTKLTTLKNFNKNCYEDGLNFILSNEKSDLIDGCKAFYDATGIQVHIILMDYEDIPGITVQESTAGRFGNRLLTFVIIVAIIGIIIFIAKKIINKKKKDKEEMERILNTPLEKYEDFKTEELKDKYN